MNTNNRTDKNKLYMGKDRNANPHKHESSEVCLKKKLSFSFYCREKNTALLQFSEKSKLLHFI